MGDTKHASADGATWKRSLKWAIRLLGSLKLAVVLLATLAAVIAAATILETDYGRAYAQWYVYHSTWFIALLALLGVNILCATLVRWPWKRHQLGFVITHAGLLVLLTGSIQSFVAGVEGQVTLAEGESTTTMIIPQQGQITAFWADRPNEAPYEFPFEPGPVDWREGKTLRLGRIDGVSARVLHYYRHAKAAEEWVPDESRMGGPVVKLKVEGPHASGSVDHVLVDQDHGDEARIGPIRVQLQRTAAGVMLEDFLKPAAVELGQKGLLKFQYRHPALTFPTSVELLQTSDDNLYYRMLADNRLVSSGKAQLGSPMEWPGQFKVTLADYLPHAREQIVFEPVEEDADQTEKAEAAVEVAVSAAGVTQTVWLQRNHPNFGVRAIATPEGSLRVRFGYGEAPLGFSLNLVKFRRDTNPGGVGNARFASLVHVADNHRGLDEDREISMNEPLTYNRLTFYQSGFNEGDQGPLTSTFSVAHDPGRLWKYLGSLMVCLGITIMFYMRAYFFKRVAQAPKRFAFSPSDSSLDRENPDEGARPSSQPPETVGSGTHAALRANGTIGDLNSAVANTRSQ